MYAILGIVGVKPEHLETFVAQLRAHARRSLGEPGCVRFDVLQDRDNPHTICLYEVFRSEADLDHHRQQDYYRRWMEMSRDWRDHNASHRHVCDYIYPPDPGRTQK